MSRSGGGRGVSGRGRRALPRRASSPAVRLRPGRGAALAASARAALIPARHSALHVCLTTLTPID